MLSDENFCLHLPVDTLKVISTISLYLIHHRIQICFVDRMQLKSGAGCHTMRAYTISLNRKRRNNKTLEYQPMTADGKAFPRDQHLHLKRLLE